MIRLLKDVERADRQVTKRKNASEVYCLQKVDYWPFVPLQIRVSDEKLSFDITARLYNVLLVRLTAFTHQTIVITHGGG
jgi:hypothetical protein